MASVDNSLAWAQKVAINENNGMLAEFEDGLHMNIWGLNWA